MNADYLLYRDADWLIAKALFRRAHPIKGMRFLNKVLLTFSPYPGFCRICLQRFQQLVCRQMKLQSIAKLIPAQVHNNPFWNKALKDFAAGQPGDRIIFDGGQKGTTRKKLYTLGMIFGYRHLFICSQKYEKPADRHGYIYYSENDIDFNKLYTKQELVKLKIDFPDMWVDSGSKTPDDRKLYAPSKEPDKNGQGWYKRGIMCNGPGTLIFIKV